jgi:hypothetical protein
MKNWYNVTLIVLIFFSLSGISHSTKDFIWVKDWISEKFKSQEVIEAEEFSNLKYDTFEFFEKSDYASKLNLKSIAGFEHTQIINLKHGINSLSNVYKKRLKSDIKKFLNFKLKYYNFHLKCSKNYLNYGKYETKDSIDIDFDILYLVTHSTVLDKNYYSSDDAIKKQLLYFEGDKEFEEFISGKNKNSDSSKKYFVYKLMQNRSDLLKLLMLEYESIYQQYYFELFNEKLNFNGV